MLSRVTRLFTTLSSSGLCGFSVINRVKYNVIIITTPPYPRGSFRYQKRDYRNINGQNIAVFLIIKESYKYNVYVRTTHTFGFN